MRREFEWIGVTWDNLWVYSCVMEGCILNVTRTATQRVHVLSPFDIHDTRIVHSIGG